MTDAEIRTFMTSRGFHASYLPLGAVRITMDGLPYRSIKLIQRCDELYARCGCDDPAQRRHDLLFARSCAHYAAFSYGAELLSSFHRSERDAGAAFARGRRDQERCRGRACDCKNPWLRPEFVSEILATMQPWYPSPPAEVLR